MTHYRLTNEPRSASEERKNGSKTTETHSDRHCTDPQKRVEQVERSTDYTDA